MKLEYKRPNDRNGANDDDDDDDDGDDGEDDNKTNQKENRSDVLARLKHFDVITLKSGGTATVYGYNFSKKQLNRFIKDYLQKNKTLNDAGFKNVII